MPSLRHLLLAGGYCLGLYVISSQVPRGETHPLLLLYFALFGLYFWFLDQKQPLSPTQLLVLAALFRLAVSTELPWLTDDFYRFIWDGRLLHAGIHPFAYTPAEAPIRFEEYTQLNSPRYYSVYPSVCQGVFFLSAYGKSTFAATQIIRALTLVADLCTVAIMVRAFGVNRAAWYAFNPLVIIEICGNLHFEGLAIMWLVLTLTRLPLRTHTVMPAEHSSVSTKQLLTAAIFFSLAIATKITPLLIAPFLLFAIHQSQWMRFVGICIMATAVLFAPLLNHTEYIHHLTTSLDLYFRDFQFNASIFYVLDGLYRYAHGYSGILWIGPLLSYFLVSALLGLIWSVWKRQLDVGSAITWAFLCHLFFSTTVHPWYVLIPFATAFFAEDKRLLPFVTSWTALVFLSYTHYTGNVYSEKYLMIGLEYACLFAVWIICTRRKWSM